MNTAITMTTTAKPVEIQPERLARAAIRLVSMKSVGTIDTNVYTNKSTWFVLIVSGL